MKEQNSEKQKERKWMVGLETYGAVLGAALSALFAYFLSSPTQTDVKIENVFQVSEGIRPILFGVLLLIFVGFLAKILYVFNRVTGYINPEGEIPDTDELLDEDDIFDML